MLHTSVEKLAYSNRLISVQSELVNQMKYLLILCTPDAIFDCGVLMSCFIICAPFKSYISTVVLPPPHCRAKNYRE
jgi:hypothetical protein